MKQLFFIVFIGITLSLGYFWFNQKNESQQTQTLDKGIIPTKNEVLGQNSASHVTSQSIFVPSWSLKSDSSLETSGLSQYDRLIYFGISPAQYGINKDEAGFKMMDIFLKEVPSDKKKYLTLRMINDDVTLPILKNLQSQNNIISETIELVQQKHFDGLVLDLEISYSLNDATKGQINDFVQQFYASAKKYYIPLSLTIYGDAFYRRRPYDLRFLAEHSDEIMIMAYDFHKSRGEPGPNFPLDSKDLHEYDFKQMTADFLAVVPKEKLTVIFGMYGYDWAVDEKKRPYKQAQSLGLNEIKQKFVEEGCQLESCIVKRDDLSSETEIDYVISTNSPDEQGIYRIDYHIVWFEDEKSAKLKTDYLLQNGINKISYWAYGYF